MADIRDAATGEGEARRYFLDRLLGQVHLGADLPVGQPIGDQLEDAPLLRSQRLVPRVDRGIAGPPRPLPHHTNEQQIRKRRSTCRQALRAR